MSDRPIAGNNLVYWRKFYTETLPHDNVVQRLLDEVEDWRECASKAAGEVCPDPTNLVHCTCVPLLRKRIAELEAEVHDAWRVAVPNYPDDYEIPHSLADEIKLALRNMGANWDEALSSCAERLKDKHKETMQALTSSNELNGMLNKRIAALEAENERLRRNRTDVCAALIHSHKDFEGGLRYDEMEGAVKTLREENERLRDGVQEIADGFKGQDPCGGSLWLGGSAVMTLRQLAGRDSITGATR